MPAIATGANRCEVLSRVGSNLENTIRELHPIPAPEEFRAGSHSDLVASEFSEKSKDVAVEVRYVGNHGSDLFQTINGNPFVAPWQALPESGAVGITPCATPPIPSAAGRENCNQASWPSSAISRIRTTKLYKLKSGDGSMETVDFAVGVHIQQDDRQCFVGLPYDRVCRKQPCRSAGSVQYAGGEHGISGLDFPNNWTISFKESFRLPAPARDHRPRSWWLGRGGKLSDHFRAGLHAHSGIPAINVLLQPGASTRLTTTNSLRV